MSSGFDDLKNAPIVFFCYNRLQHTQRTIEALKNNTLASESDLVIYSDASKNDAHVDEVAAVRAYLKTISGFSSVKIILRQENMGLASSIIDGVSAVVNEYGQVIVLEDDLVTSPYFLQFMNDGLRRYEMNKEVASIHGYVYPIENLPETFFMRGADCWGWATWRDRWQMFESDGEILLSELVRKKLTHYFDLNGAYPFTQMLRDQISGKNNSWAIRWHASAFLNKKFTLYPGKSLVLNIGNDNSGTHSGNTDAYSSDVSATAITVRAMPVEEDAFALDAFGRHFIKLRGGLIGGVKRLLSRVLNGFLR